MSRIKNTKYLLLVNLAILLMVLPLLSACAEEVMNEEGALPTIKGIEQIRISALRLDSRAPASLETINAVGFDPAGDLWVRFFDNKGFSVDCPAIDATSTSLTVSVPPYIDFRTGQFASGIVCVQVFQKSETATLISNTISGFHIEDLPSVTGETGDATIAYLDGIIHLIDETTGNLATVEQMSNGEVSSPELIFLLSELRANYVAIKREVESVIADPKKSIVFAKMGDINLELNIGSIHEIDRLITAVEQQVASEATTSSVPSMKGADIALQKQRQEKPHAVLPSWIQAKPVLALSNTETDYEGAFSSNDQSSGDGLKEALTWAGYGGTMAGWYDLFGKNKSVKKYLGAYGRLTDLLWVGTTVVPETEVLYANLTSQSITHWGEGSWEQWKAAAPSIERFVTKVAPGLFDMYMGIPLFGTIDILADAILGPDWGRTGGIEIAKVVENNLFMQVSYVETQLANREPSPPPTPTPTSCPPGYVCMTEAEAQDSPLWWEPYSSDQCSPGKYCWRQVAPPTPTPPTPTPPTPTPPTPPTGVQTWKIVDDSGQHTATLTVDSSGNFTGSGWVGRTPQGTYDIYIQDGRMSGTSMTFNEIASYDGNSGHISGRGTGTLNNSFPSATSATGTVSGTIRDPLGTRSFSFKWKATRTSR